MLLVNKNIPEGTRDILLEECEDIVYMENLLREIYIKRGFEEEKPKIEEPSNEEKLLTEIRDLLKEDK